MTLQKDHVTVQRFLTALLVQFIREQSTGYIRFNNLPSDQPILDKKWAGIEFAGEESQFAPQIIVSSLIQDLVEAWLYEQETVNEDEPEDGGFCFSVQSSTPDPVLRKVIPLVNVSEEGKTLEFVIVEFPPDIQVEMPVLAVTAKDRLPLGMKYIWELAENIEVSEAAREFENQDFPVVKLVNNLMEHLLTKNAGDRLVVLPHNPTAGEKPDRLISIIQTTGDDVEMILEMMPHLSRYMVPRFKVIAGLDPWASPPVESEVSVSFDEGMLQCRLRIDTMDNFEAVTLEKLV